MKFVVSSMELLGHLQAISRVISNKNTLPILDNFLFSLEDGILEIPILNRLWLRISSLKIQMVQVPWRFPQDC